ncbi:MAG: polysaccharide deacetylase [Roseiflexaceae bacterium]
MIGRQRTTFALAALAIVLLGLAGLVVVTQNRQARCAAIPFWTRELLPNAALAAGDDPKMPEQWSRAANGVELRGPAIGQGEGFDYNSDGRALQLIGIGNYVQTPPIAVQPSTRYCFAGRALTDKRSATRLRLIFDWRDGQNRPLGKNVTDWQPVVLWQPDAQPDDWSAIIGAFDAPARATTLLIQLQPASDDRVYLDAMHVQRTNDQRPTTNDGQSPGSRLSSPVSINPWPNGYRAATSFSFDWETAMGGLIHSRSDDPNSTENPKARGLRMREGITTTLRLFQPLDIHATYYANGYNFLLGNAEQRQFMDNPTYAWASKANGWPTDTWKTTPWFAKDPYGVIQSDPSWYFGDLIAPLQREQQDIQSHTFSHFSGGDATATDWQNDLQAWRVVAAERNVPPARSLAFPWSRSNGMSYADWDALEAAGITSVTRTNWNPRQPQYHIVSSIDPHCRPIPGHERILACPDFYLHSQETAAQALKLIDHTIAIGGMIDLWAHTEEVTSPEQIAAWSQVVSYAAQQRDAGALWIAPLAEIADWQAAIAECKIENVEVKTQSNTSILSFKLTNGSNRDLNGLTLTLPFKPKQLTVNRIILNSQFSTLNLPAGQTLEVQAWPA